MVVAALDRLARSLSAVIRAVEPLTVARVVQRSLRECIDRSTAAGRMLAGIFTSWAAYERELMHEHATADLVTSISRGTTYRALDGHRDPRPCALVPGCGTLINAGGGLTR